MRSFDIEARERASTARYVETLNTAIAEDIVSRVISVIDPAGQLGDGELTTLTRLPDTP